MSSDELKFKEGTIVTCENGHEVCEFSRDIYSYSEIHADDFTNFRRNMTAPLEYERVGDHPCHCGKNWIQYDGIIRVHIKKKGWK